ncbi:MAG: hypothetical protein ABI700_27105 [Chloroflexota bacterium]
MMQPTAIALFVVFGLILFAMYIAIRRRFASPVIISAIGVFANIVVMTLIGLAQGDTIYQAIFAGLLIGGLFSGGVLAMAVYFQNNEQRRGR